jgi:NADH-quinone oxidoreductase subunit N
VRDTGSEALEAFRGLAKRSPLLALLCTVFLLSLAGIPPLLGFFGKFLLLGAAVEARAMGLAIAGIINSAIALYYYVNIIRLMYLAEPAQGRAVRADGALRLALVLCFAGTLWLGLFPGSLLTTIRSMASVILL